MRITFLLLLFLTLYQECDCQDRILYDLDSYRRVDINLRTTQISPDIGLFYDKQLNTPGSSKKYKISVSGRYTDTYQINNAKTQNSVYQSLNFDIRSGTDKSASIIYNYRKTKRKYNDYNDLNYFKNGFDIFSNASYNDNQNSTPRYNQVLNAQYDIGFGFGRMEVVNNAWIGARILEELDHKNLLINKPNGEEMKIFFDLIGDIEFTRVLDTRLRSIYRIENIISYLEEKGWIEKGSIPAFVTIYDAYRYENFIIRESGKRLEFTLTPYLAGQYAWRGAGIIVLDNFIQPGFIGTAEYEIHRNGDLEYYTITSYGGIIEHYERLYEKSNDEFKSISGDIFFKYQFRYIPSLRTNMDLNVCFLGGFDYSISNDYDANISVVSSYSYIYYLSPATQLVLDMSATYNDNRFQIGAYQPRITGSVSFDIVHAIR